MRPIDADWLLSFIHLDEKVIAPEQHTAQDIIMMIQAAPTLAPPSNDPLTLEELREMDGEPVYLIDKTDPSDEEWVIWDEDWTSNWFEDAENYGKTWIAYRRKPEEDTT